MSSERLRQHSRLYLSIGFACAICCTTPDGPLALVDGNINRFWKRGPAATLGLVVSVLISAMVVCTSPSTRARLRRRGKALIVMALILFASAIASVNTMATCIEAVGLLATAPLAAWLMSVQRLHAGRSIASGISFLTVGSIASAPLIMLPPHLRILSDSFQGLFTQNNYFGAWAAAGFSVCLCLAIEVHGRAEVSLWSVLAIVNLGVVLHSSSATAIGLVLIGAGTAMTILFRRKLLGHLPPLPANLVLVLPWSILGLFSWRRLPSVLALFGKSTTLNGRAELWRASLTPIRRRPVRGWGYSAVWTNRNPANVFVSQSWGARALHLHNGLLEIGLGVGMVGTSIILFGLLRAVLTSISVGTQPGYLWLPSLAMVGVFGLITESLGTLGLTVPALAILCGLLCPELRRGETCGR